jgi:hypothetical protein
MIKYGKNDIRRHAALNRLSRIWLDQTTPYLEALLKAGVIKEHRPQAAQWWRTWTETALRDAENKSSLAMDEAVSQLRRDELKPRFGSNLIRADRL